MFSGLLSLSILAPSVCTLLDATIEFSALQESQDDDSQKKGEKELEEKQWLAFEFNKNSKLNFAQLANANTFYKQGNYTITLDIILPPPKRQL